MTGGGAKRGSAAPRGKAPPLDPEEERLRIQAFAAVHQQYRSMDIVWGKMGGFPWWPGMLFLSWDDVEAAGVDVSAEENRNLPPPEKMCHSAQPGDDGGDAGEQDPTAFTLEYFAIVMFLDKFNFSLVKLTPKFVRPFTIYYESYSNAVLRSKTAKDKSGFRRALLKAEKLLHAADNTESEAHWPLIPVGLPSADKRQRVESPRPSSRAKPISVDADDEEWEEVNATDEDVDGDDEEYVEEVQVVPAPKKAGAKSKQSSKDTSRDTGPKRERRPIGRLSQADSSDFIDNEVFEPAEPKPAPARKKSAAKAVRKEIINVEKKIKSRASNPSTLLAPIDLTGIPDVPKRKLKKAPSKSTPTRRPAEAKKAVAPGKASKSTKKGSTPHDTVIVLSADAKLDGQRKLSKGKLLENEVECLDSTEGESGQEGTESDAKNNNSERLATPLCHIWTSPSIALGQNLEVVSNSTPTVFKQDFLWDESLFTDSDGSELQVDEDEEEAETASSQDRPLGKRQMRSVHQSQIRQNLMMGNLDPHTMVQCESYRLKEPALDLTSRNNRGGGNLEQPFQVRVHPDATFLCDLHAHLATCEIIGFLGGRWNEATKTLDIQAAFPCRSLMIDGDDGSTDVEMDPGSEIELREIIENAQLEVVGWYHSHPAFAPDPSVRDIENQGSYQQLFQRRTRIANSDCKSGFIDVVSEPFVGLIVGTYDTRRDTPVSLFRYFHVRNEKVSSSIQREISMPYELVPSNRHYRSVIQDEKRAKVQKMAMYPSVFRVMLGKYANWTFKKPALPPLCVGEIFPMPDVRGSVSAGRLSKVPKSSSFTKKRKPSFENAATSPKAAKKGRPRGRPPRKISVSIEKNDGLRIDEDQEKSMDTALAADIVASISPPEQMNDDEIPETLQQTDVISMDDATPMLVDENKEVVDVSSLTALRSDDVVKSDSVAASPRCYDTEAISSLNELEPVKKSDEIPVVNWFPANPDEENEDICVIPDIDSEPEVNLDVHSESSVQNLTTPLGSEVVSLEEEPNKIENALDDQVTSCVEIVMEDVLSNVVAVVNDVQVSHSELEETLLVTGTTDVKLLNSPLNASSTESSLCAEKQVGLRSSKRAPPPAIIVSTDTIRNYDEVPSTDSTPVMSQAHTNPSSANARRRNRKPIQTVKKQGLSYPQGTSQDNIRSSPLSGPSSGSLQERSAYAAAFQVNGPIIDCGGTIPVYSDRENTRASHDKKGKLRVTLDQPDEYIYDVEFSHHVNDAILEKHLAMKNESLELPTETALIVPVESVNFEDNKNSDPHTDSMKIDDDGGVAANQSEVLPRVQTETMITDVMIVNSVKSEEEPCVMTVIPASNASALHQAGDQVFLTIIETSESSELDPDTRSERFNDECAIVENGFDSFIVAQVVSSVMEACLTKLIEADILTYELRAREQAVIQEMDLCLNKLVEQELVKQEPIPINEDTSVKQELAKEESFPITEVVTSTPPVTMQETNADDNKSSTIDLSTEPASSIVDDNKIDQNSTPMATFENVQVSSALENIPLSVSPQKVPSIIDNDARTDDEMAVNTINRTKKDVIFDDASTVVSKIELSIPDTPLYLRCGAGQNVQDIQTSLASIMPILATMKEEAKKWHNKIHVATPETKQASMKPKQSREITKSIDSVVNREENEQKLLHSLRTKYGAGSAACAEQAITLIDYYRKFERRTELKDMWKGKTSKLAKIEASMMEYVQRINVPMALRQDFVRDLIGYLGLTWKE